MATISVRQPHTRGLEEVQQMASALAEQLREHYDLESHWADDRTVDFRRRGIRGRLQFDEREVSIELQLGMMVFPFKERVRRELERALTEQLG